MILARLFGTKYTQGPPYRTRPNLIWDGFIAKIIGLDSHGYKLC